MPSGLFALLDDVATIAKLTAASRDDVAGAAGRAGTKAAGGLGGVISWLVTALAGAATGIVIGGIIVLIVRRFTKHPEELIVD
jgi:predicted DNA repair protein MutK